MNESTKGSSHKEKEEGEDIKDEQPHETNEAREETKGEERNIQQCTQMDERKDSNPGTKHKKKKKKKKEEQVDWTKVPKFKEYFPKLSKGILRAKDEVDFADMGENPPFKSQNPFFLQFYPEIRRTIPKWGALETQGNGQICCHVLRVLICLLEDPSYPQLSSYERNLLKWVVILHDVAKRGYPTLPIYYRDFVHPYTSAIEALPVLCTILHIQDADALNAMKTLQMKINSSIKEDREFDLSQLGEILTQASKLFGAESFGHLVFKMVIMHQALPTVPDFYCPQSLSSSEIQLYCDSHFLKLMKLFMIIDSINYNMHIPTYMEKYRRAFEDHFKALNI